MRSLDITILKRLVSGSEPEGQMKEKGLTSPKPLAYTPIMTSRELQEWRKRNGFSQSQLARVLDVDSITVSRWERGVRKIPSFLHLALECIETKGKKMKKERKVKA